MASNDFELTVENVRAHHFVLMDAWTQSSRPAESAVEEVIAEEAAAMAGKLALELIDASAIEADTDAWNNCKRILRKQVAINVARNMLGADSSLFAQWEEDVTEWYAAVKTGGAEFLGDGATKTGSIEPDGPVSHVSVYGLERVAADELSSPKPFLKMDDDL